MWACMASSRPPTLKDIHALEMVQPWLDLVTGDRIKVLQTFGETVIGRESAGSRLSGSKGEGPNPAAGKIFLHLEISVQVFTNYPVPIVQVFPLELFLPMTSAAI